MPVKNYQVRGFIQLLISVILTIFLWLQVPSWEVKLLSIIASDPNSLNIFGGFWIHIVLFLLNYWEIISFLVLIESLYEIILNRSMVRDLFQKLDKLLSMRDYN